MYQTFAYHCMIMLGFYCYLSSYSEIMEHTMPHVMSMMHFEMWLRFVFFGFFFVHLFSLRADYIVVNYFHFLGYG